MLRLFADPESWSHHELSNICERFNVKVPSQTDKQKMCDMLDTMLQDMQLKRMDWTNLELIKICRTLHMPYLSSREEARSFTTAICNRLNGLRAEATAATTPCLVCEIDFPVGERLETHCGHLIDYCAECMEQWLSSQLDTHSPNGIACPEDNCEDMLSPEDMEDYLPFLDFKRLRMRYFATLFGGFICPIEDCGHAISESADGELSFVTCGNCQHQVCLNCHSEWHSDVSCEQFQADLTREAEKRAEEIEEQEEASDQYLQNRTPNCPGCKAPIEKFGGCDHMRCGM